MVAKFQFEIKTYTYTLYFALVDHSNVCPEIHRSGRFFGWREYCILGTFVLTNTPKIPIHNYQQVTNN